MAEKGRPKVLDEEKRTLICGLVGMGCSRKQAARHLGIGVTTLFEALRKDKDFAERLRRSEMNQDITPLRRILDHSQKSWRAAAWILERQNPNRYGRRAPRTITLADANRVLVAILDCVLEDVRSSEDRETVFNKLKELAERLGGSQDTSPRVRRALKDLKTREAPAGASPVAEAANFRTAAQSSESAESRSPGASNTLFEQGAGI